jgi:hypothetical protein
VPLTRSRPDDAGRGAPTRSPRRKRRRRRGSERER